METPLEKLTAKIFSEQLHSKFKVQIENTEPVELELCEVNEPPTAPRLELFSVIFSGPPVPWLPQRIHRLEHAKLGTLQIFLTAVAGDADGISYEAVFSRIRNRQK